MRPKQHNLLHRLMREHLRSLVLGFGLLLLALSIYFAMEIFLQWQMHSKYIAAQLLPLFSDSIKLPVAAQVQTAIAGLLDSNTLAGIEIHDSHDQLVMQWTPANNWQTHLQNRPGLLRVSADMAQDNRLNAKLSVYPLIVPILFAYAKSLLIAGLLCGMAMLLIMRRFALKLKRACTPVLHMVDSVDAIQNLCDFTVRVPYHSVRELQSLSQYFNRLLDLNEERARLQVERYDNAQFITSRREILATHDELTHLPNRQYFHRALGNCLKDAVANKELAALMFIDLDDFKSINQQYGMAAADYVLKTLAQRLATVLRCTDTLCRVAGDEFAVILPQVSNAEASMLLAKRLQNCFSTSIFFAEQKIPIKASIGLACCSLDAQDQRALLRRADSALRAAKLAGKIQYVG